MKKYLLSIITVLVMLLTACDSGLNIKERIISSFNENDKTIFLTFVDNLAIDAAKYGYTMGTPITIDTLLEITATKGADSYTVKIEILNGEFLVTETDISNGQTNESTETYSDLDTWYFYATHDIESRQIEGQTVKIEFVETSANHLSGYLFDENTLTSDTSREIVSVTLWPETGSWKEVIEYSLTTPDLQVGRLLCDENGYEITYSFKAYHNYNGNWVDVIGVHIFPTDGNFIHITKFYLASDVSGWDVSTATRIEEHTSIPNNGLAYTWQVFTNGVLTQDEITDVNGNTTFRSYDINGNFIARGFRENNISHRFEQLTNYVFDQTAGEKILVNVLSERIEYPEGYTIRTDYLASTCNMTTLEYNENSIRVWLNDSRYGITEYDTDGNLYTP